MTGRISLQGMQPLESSSTNVTIAVPFERPQIRERRRTRPRCRNRPAR